MFISLVHVKAGLKRGLSAPREPVLRQYPLLPPETIRSQLPPPRRRRRRHLLGHFLNRHLMPVSLSPISSANVPIARSLKYTRPLPNTLPQLAIRSPLPRPKKQYSSQRGKQWYPHTQPNSEPDFRRVLGCACRTRCGGRMRTIPTHQRRPCRETPTRMTRLQIRNRHKREARRPSGAIVDFASHLSAVECENVRILAAARDVSACGAAPCFTGAAEECVGACLFEGCEDVG